MDLVYSLLILTFSIVYIMDHSGFLFSFTKFIYGIFNPGKEYLGQALPKPFSCSVCMTFWIVLIFTILNGVAVIYSVGISSAFAIISTIMSKVLKIIIKLINKI